VSAIEPAVERPPVVVRIWSPLTAALFALLLGFPAGVAIATRNWGRLGMQKEWSRHLAGAFLLSIPVALLFVLLSSRAGRVVGALLSITAFSYLKAKLHSDLEELRAGRPEMTVQYRPWYSAFGWALLGMTVFLLIYFAVLVTVSLIGMAVPD
jgi:hypothetical protein